MRMLFKLFLTCIGVGCTMMTVVLHVYLYSQVNVFRVSKEKRNKPSSTPDFTSSIRATNDRNEPSVESLQLIPRTPGSQLCTTRKFVEMKFGPVFIFGAVGGNYSDSETCDYFKVYGMLDSALYAKSLLKCCFMYSQNNSIVIKVEEPFAKRKFKVQSNMWNFYLACPFLEFNKNGIPHMAVTIDRYTCSRDHVTYVQPYFPVKEQNKIAIGTTTAYGNIDAELIIEWMEAYKYLGVDRIVTYYVNSINENALKVLNYYASTGILDLSYYEPANEAKYPRTGEFRQEWNDEATIIDDSFERMSGYRYFGIIDHDEFFIPGKHGTLMEMLLHLEKLHQKVAGFTFLSQYYYLSWGKYSNNSDMILGSYTRREGTKPRIEHAKNIYMPSQVAPGGVDTHEIIVNEGHRMHILEAEYGYVRHFRKCRSDEDDEFVKCMNKTERVFDDEVAKWSEAFRENVRKVRRTVLGIS